MSTNPYSNAQSVYAVIRIRRGPEADRTQYIYDSGELIFSTDKKRLYIGDGVNNKGTYGGNIVANKTWVVDSFTNLPYIVKNDLVYRTDSGNCGFYILTGDNPILPNSYVLVGGRGLINDTVTIPAPYALPFANRNTHGGVIVSDGLAISEGFISVNVDNQTIALNVNQELTVTSGINSLIGKASYSEYGKVIIDPDDSPLKITDGKIAFRYDSSTLKIDANNQLAVQDVIATPVPLASNTEFGKVKIIPNNGLDITNGNLKINYDSTTIGVNSKNELTFIGPTVTPSTPISYVLPTATSSRLGGVLIGNNITVDGAGTISVNDTLFIKTPVPAPTADDYVLTYDRSSSTWVGRAKGNYIPKPTTNLLAGKILAYDATTQTWNPSSITEVINKNGGSVSLGSSEDLVPIGTISYHTSDVVPAGYLACEGQLEDISVYGDLAAVLGTKFKSGTETFPAGKFRLPDLRGEFIRGWSHGKPGVDTGRVFGTYQPDEFKSHTHSLDKVLTWPARVNYPAVAEQNQSGNPDDYSAYMTSTSAAGGSETRPRNIALYGIIKALKVVPSTTPLNFIEKPAGPKDGQSLVYNQAQNKWLPGDSVSSGGGDVPVGTIVYFAAATAPTGYLECNGTTVSRSKYPELFAIVQTTFEITGDGTPTTDFRLPDLRGEFIRGWDHAVTGTQPRSKKLEDRVFGSWQKGTIMGYDQGNDAVWHVTSKDSTVGTNTQPMIGVDDYNVSDYAGVRLKGVSPTDGRDLKGGTSDSGGFTGGFTGITRPRNIALMACIKAVKTGTPSVINYIEKPAATNGQILKFNGTSNAWEAGNAPATEGTFGTLAAGTGYTSLPNGIIMQWGSLRTGVYKSTVNVDVTFPKAFPNACFSFVASIGVSTLNYDYVPQYRTNRHAVSYGAPTRYGVQGQAFLDTINTDDRIIQWYAIGN